MESDYSYDVFLSYNSDDQSAAEFLVNKLMAGGVQVFWDRNLAAGDPWLVVLEKALLRSQTVMFLLGPSGFGRGQQREVEQLVIARGSRRAIPVLLPGSKDSDLPLTLRGYIWVDLRKGLDDPDAFNQLVEVIQGKRPLFDRLSPRARKAILRADTFRRSIGGGQAPMGTTASLTFAAIIISIEVFGAVLASCHTSKLYRADSLFSMLLSGLLILSVLAILLRHDYLCIKLVLEFVKATPRGVAFFLSLVGCAVGRLLTRNEQERSHAGCYQPA